MGYDGISFVPKNNYLLCSLKNTTRSKKPVNRSMYALRKKSYGTISPDQNEEMKKKFTAISHVIHTIIEAKDLSFVLASQMPDVAITIVHQLYIWYGRLAAIVF